jgi:hypothetical protein
MPLEPVARHGSFFDLCIETQLAPTLHKGDVVILDKRGGFLGLFGTR